MSGGTFPVPDVHCHAEMIKLSAKQYLYQPDRYSEQYMLSCPGLLNLTLWYTIYRYFGVKNVLVLKKSNLIFKFLKKNNFLPWSAKYIVPVMYLAYCIWMLQPQALCGLGSWVSVSFRVKPRASLPAFSKAFRWPLNHQWSADRNTKATMGWESCSCYWLVLLQNEKKPQNISRSLGFT